MNKTTYNLIDVDSEEFKAVNDTDYGYDSDSLLAIVRREYGEVVEVLAVDGGEPEDNTFGRDGAWITPALNAAYRRGHAEGFHEGYAARSANAQDNE